jgi:hypothetical protein
VWAPLGAHVSVVRAPEGRIESLDVDTVIAAAAARRRKAL